MIPKREPMQSKLTQLFSVVGLLCLFFTTSSQALHSSYYNQYIEVDVSPNNTHGIHELLVYAEEDFSVQKYVTQYTVQGKHATERLLGKGAYYFPIFEFYLSKKGLPDALKYLPAVESHLYPKVKSGRGAAGLWQFMPATGRHYGLRVDEQVDERFDPHLASEAAATMLADLYQQFGDWNLVLSAYNCGPGRVRKAMRKAGSKQYADIRQYLPKQTQQYTDKITAFLFVAQNHQELNIQAKVSPSIQKRLVQTVKFHGAYNLEQLAKAAQMDITYLQALNPKYTSTQLAAYQTYELQVPDYAKTLLDNYFDSRLAPEVEEQEIRSNQEQLFTQLCFFDHHPSDLFSISAPGEQVPPKSNLVNRSTWALVRKSILV
ncbi:MAG: hypothetical protein Sapg2KO_32550 [Saprospiraceae bacterium]